MNNDQVIQSISVQVRSAFLCTTSVRSRLMRHFTSINLVINFMGIIKCWHHSDIWIFQDEYNN